MRIIIIFSFLLFLVSCNSEEKELEIEEDLIKQRTLTNVKYAEGFTIKEYEEYKVLIINEAWKDAGETHKYVLYENDKPENIGGATFIKVPIQSIACVSLTHVAFLEKLGLEKTIIGISGCDYVSSNKVRKEIANGSIKEIGQDQNVNYEVLVENSPDFIMSYGINSTSNGSLNKMKELGLKVVLNSEYMETHPLGKAEWIKFVAAFYNKTTEANIIFNEIEQEYLSLLELTKDIKEKPTVFTGMPWNGSWYVPGGSSFQAKLFKDAGANYLWSDNDEKASLIKAKEIIIDEAYNADFWLNLNSYSTITSVVDFDDKFKGFTAVKEKHLFNNDAILNEKGGNVYWESGVVNPQLVLKDLIEIFHPDILEHELYYYRKMK